PDKPKIDNFESLLKRLKKIQPGLDSSLRTEAALRDRILLACDDIQECELAILKPSPTLQGVCADLRNAIKTRTKIVKRQFLQQQTDGEQYWTDRTFGRAKQVDHGSSNRGSHFRGSDRRTDFQRSRLSDRGRQPPRTRKCYVCGKTGCWSSSHPIQERRSAYNRYRDTAYVSRADPSPEAYHAFLVEFEGLELDELANPDHSDEETQFFTEFGTLDDDNAISTLATLNDLTVFHAAT
ncbi:hypothetical protein K3495_g16788, partial [Podosphaera aphanis]